MEIVAESGGFLLSWRQPINGEFAIRLRPRLSGGALDAEPQQQFATAQTLTRQWRVKALDSDLIGQQFSVEGLERTLTDVLLRVQWQNGEQSTHLLKPLTPALTLQRPTGRGAAVNQYAKLGFTHLWEGYDHLLYLLGLVLLARRFASLITMITAFTLAHSLTLALSVLGWVRLPSVGVEAVIALSVVYVAWEAARQSRAQQDLRALEHSWAQRWPWLIAFTFGLLHGFGFATVLRSIGLPDNEVAMPLLFFNVGLEAGQLLFVAAAVLLLAAFSKYASRLSKWTRLALPFAIGGIAMAWLIERLLAVVA